MCHFYIFTVYNTLILFTAIFQHFPLKYFSPLKTVRFHTDKNLQKIRSIRSMRATRSMRSIRD